MTLTNIYDSALSTELKGVSILNEEEQVEENTLVTLSADQSVDDKCAPREEITSPLNAAANMEFSQNDTLDGWNSANDVLKEEIAPIDDVLERGDHSRPDIDKMDEAGYTSLYKAALEGDLDRVDDLISNGASPDQRCKDGLSPLHAACQKGHANIVYYLILHGVDVNLQCNLGRTPLHNSAEKGHSGILESLIKGGANTNKKDVKGWKPIQFAVKYGQLEAVKRLKTEGLTENSHDELNILYLAALYGHLDVVKFLILKGADVNKGNNDRVTPLHAAITRGHLNVMEYLIDQDCDVNKGDDNGWTPFHSAIQYGNVEHVKYLINCGVNQNRYDGMTPLYMASHFGHLDLVEFFISRGADVSEENDDGKIPLHGAAAKGHMKVMEYLIEHGSDLNKTDFKGLEPFGAAVKCCQLEAARYLYTQGVTENTWDGRTLLYLGALCGHLDIVECLASNAIDLTKEDGVGMKFLHLDSRQRKVMESLIQRGLDAHKTYNTDRKPFKAGVQHGSLYGLDEKSSSFEVSPLYAAAYSGHLDIVKFFVSKGNDVNEGKNNGMAPLHAASANGHLEVMKYLIQQGADADRSDTRGWTPIHTAVRSGHLAAVKYLLTEGVDMSRYNGRTLVSLAAQYGHLDIVKYLLTKGADVNDEDDEGIIPLHGAASRGHMKLISYLIQQGSNVNKTDASGWTPFNAAVQYGQNEAVRYLRTEGVMGNSYAGMTPLYEAARYGHFDIVQFLISKGADVNEESKQIRLPLHGAAMNGDMDVIRYLIEQGADINKCDDKGWTPFNAAVQYGNLEAVKYLMTHGVTENGYVGMTPLYHAAQSGHLNIVKFFFSKGADVNEEDAEGDIPLHGAATRGHVQVMEYLIQHGSDVNKANADDWTPFHAAVQSGHLEAVKYLQTQGALENRCGRMTPLYVAALFGNLHIVEYFVSKGADLNESYIKGSTPFNAAVQYGHLETVKYLLTIGAKETTCRGMTSLYLASRYGHLDIVKFLISKGADVNEGSDDGMIPLHGAAAGGHIKDMQYLVLKGSDLNNKENQEKWTPSYAALQFGQLEAIKYLIDIGASQNTNEKMSPLETAAHFGYLDIVRFYISKGTDESIVLPLYIAAAGGHTKVIDYLIEQGYNLNEKDKNGLTPVHAAAICNPLEVAQYLTSKVPAKNMYIVKAMALSEVAQFSNIDNVKVLISKGTDVSKEYPVLREEDTPHEDKDDCVRYENHWNNTICSTEGWYTISEGGGDMLSRKEHSINPKYDDASSLLGYENHHGLVCDFQFPAKKKSKTSDEDEYKWSIKRSSPPNCPTQRPNALLNVREPPPCNRYRTHLIDGSAKRCDIQLSSGAVNVGQSQNYFLADFHGKEISVDEMEFQPRMLPSAEDENNETSIFIKKSLGNDTIPPKQDHVLLPRAPESLARKSSTDGERTIPEESESFAKNTYDSGTNIHTTGANSHSSTDMTEAEPRCSTLLTELSSWMEAGKDVLRTSFISNSDLLNDENQDSILHQKSYEVDRFSTERSSSQETEKKHRTVNNPFVVLLTVFRMIISFAILLAGCPVLVAGSSTPDRVTLIEGKPGVIPFNISWPLDSTSHLFPYYTLRFESMQRPFFVNGNCVIDGLKTPSQLPRFSISVTKLDGSLSVNVNIDTVHTLDEDVYVLTALMYGLQDVLQASAKREVLVHVPPGPAKCFITVSQNDSYLYEVHCHALSGDGETTLTCYQDNHIVKEFKEPIKDNGIVTRAIFLLHDNRDFHCCSHDVNSNVNQVICNDFQWPPNRKLGDKDVGSTETLSTVTTSVHHITTAYEYELLYPTQIGSQIESGACSQYIIPSMQSFVYLLIFSILSGMMQWTQTLT